MLTSIAIIMIYLAYLMVTGPMLKKRLRGQWPPADLEAGGYFTMGRWGLLVNVVAVLWGAGMALNLAWPREAVYGTPWYNTWGAFAIYGRDPRGRPVVVRVQGPPSHRYSGVPRRGQHGRRSPGEDLRHLVCAFGIRGAGAVAAGD